MVKKNNLKNDSFDKRDDDDMEDDFEEEGGGGKDFNPDALVEALDEDTVDDEGDESLDELEQKEHKEEEEEEDIFSNNEDENPFWKL